MSRLLGLAASVFFVGVAVHATETLPQPVDNREVLKSVFEQARADLATIETLMKNRDYSGALTKSKNSLDDVRIKSGIHPKASYREKITLPDGTLKKSFNSLGMSVKDLDIDAQDVIALAVTNHRGGYFLDILNLTKRTNLLYLEALEQTLKRDGRLLDQDAKKIRDDIMEVQAIPLYLKDSSVGAYFLVFDFEVANSDQNYLFNRELTEYLLSERHALGVKNEKQAQEMLNAHIQQVRTEYIHSSQGTGVANPPAANDNSGSASPVVTMRSSNFKKCYNIYSANYTTAGATSTCLELAPKYNFF